MKRLVDIILTTAAAPILVPLGLVVALLVRVGIGSPVLFRQLRPGLGARPFEILKFRAMTEADMPRRR